MRLRVDVPTMTGRDTDADDALEELPDDAGTSSSRRVTVDPDASDLTVAAFHTQDWLLIAEALLKTTDPMYAFTNFLEERRSYARSLAPVVAAAAGVDSTDLSAAIDPQWDGRSGGGDATDGEASRWEVPELPFPPGEARRTVDDFGRLDWLVVAEALNAWHADLRLGGPGRVSRGGDRWRELQAAVVTRAGVEEGDVLPLVRNLFEGEADRDGE